LIIGVIRESQPGEARVSATPATAAQLIKLGYEVVVEPAAGARSKFTDEAYVAAGAAIGDALKADIVFGVNAPSAEQLDAMRDDATVVSILSPDLRPGLVEDLARRPITALAMDAVPRISRAQSLDVLSSMANIAGYRAVIEAAHVFGRFFTGQVTAAGKVPPANVLVVGAGVAGLAAIGAAGSLGAVVRATDPRPEVADQVRSLGGEYLPVEAAEVEVSATGYAKEMSDDYSTKAAALYAQQCPDVDIIITTALIPGKPAPRLITAPMVASMKPGSVTIIGYTDLAGRLPAQASQLYGTNLVNLMKLMTPGKDGQLVLDFDDVVQRSMTVVRDGELTWPPPPVRVSATPAVSAPASAALAPAESHVKKHMPPGRRFAVIGTGAAVFFVLAALSPPALQPHLTVFALAIVIGYYVIGHVHHALHTPLMSVTNAISGIIVVGALLEIGQGNAWVTALSAAAILLASINIFGGFAVTRRMLSMFSRS